MRQHVAITAMLVLGLGIVACQSKKADEAKEPEKTGLAGQFDRTINDRDVMRAAVDAANKVIQNETDCDAARAAIPEAQEKLAEAAKHIATPAGKASIQALQRSVDRVADACP
jgi:hypothetical protein